MIIVDVNLLLYAVMTAFPEHERVRAWWEAAVNGTVEVGLAGPAIFGFVRLATSGRVFTAPLTVEAAVGYVNCWLAEPNVRFLLPGPRHLEVAFAILREHGTASDITTDVQLAALAVEYGGTVFSNDSDFARFPGADWRNPLR